MIYRKMYLTHNVIFIFSAIYF